MRKPAVDYKQLRLSNITSPEYRHVLLLGGWIVYFSLYFLTENLIPYERCHVIHSRLDELIPFCELFVVPYLLWFFLVAGSLLYLLLYDIPAFRKLCIYIMITQAGAMLVYILWPNLQLLRPETMPRNNFFTWVLSFVYSFDTPTGVLPSLHAAYSIAILSVFEHRKNTALWWRILLPIFVATIIAATFLVKQHSVLDALAAIPLCLIGEALIYWFKLLK